MISSYIFLFLFWGTPIAVITLFVISLCNYISAKRKNKKTPGTVSDEDIKKHKMWLIVLSVLIGVFVLIVFGLIGLFYLALMFM